ncbi:restriction modification system DNA specificity domain-containing protein [Arthrobacter crystallopoietes BAB-32]|uniref:Restriction modification system DNA specificity domain-containing protein n=2 Tax=Crystallibacter crystallopoietes TaxID=37928 RepID=N1V071_9MICC|nr:restriction modification system DNA specificity domain-containing protein [Arthrobacter crystallopoietes BAB-32]
MTSGETGGFHDEAPVKGPGVTIGRATNLGKPKWSAGDFWPHNTTMFVKDFKGNNPRWVFHLFENTDLTGFDSGSVQPMLNRNYIAQVPVAVPPRNQQDAIAEVLASLDAKIAANTKLATTIDNYFMAIWKRLALKAKGAVPLSDLIQSVTAGDWGLSEASVTHSETAYCIRGSDIPALQKNKLGNMPLRHIKPNSLLKRRLAPYDLVVEMSGGSPTQSTGRAVLITAGLLRRIDGHLSSSNFCKIIRLEEPQHSMFVYGVLRNSWTKGDFFQFENGTTGIKNLAFSDYTAMTKLSLPSQNDLCHFNGFAENIFEMLQVLGDEDVRLAEMREVLLPQLMSGSLSVKDAEKLVGTIV